MKAAPTKQPARIETRRCAIYTRKSTTMGLEQEFNSLDAQRDACVAYIQRQPGWTLVDERYDDGGYTGANIERPAFQRLMADIERREIDIVVVYKVDIVVVYKVDRLSRTSADGDGGADTQRSRSPAARRATSEGQAAALEQRFDWARAAQSDLRGAGDES